MAETLARFMASGPRMPEPLFRRLALLGVGLIGSSVARIARERGDIAAEVVANARTQGDAATAWPSWASPTASKPTRRARWQGADCVMLCAPVGAYAALAAAIAPHLAPGAILTDVGSTKQSVIRDVGPLVPAGVHFVPAHPMAGTEYSGPDAGFATLFEGRWCLLTPPPGTDAGAVERVAELWRRCGSMVELMEPAHHDRVLAIVSHLPHLIAFTICGTADDLEGETRQEVLQFAASGFRDFTRIAASRPGDVARRVPEQPRGAAGDAGALHRGRAGDGARGALGRRRPISRTGSCAAGRSGESLIELKQA